MLKDSLSLNLTRILLLFVNNLEVVVEVASIRKQSLFLCDDYVDG